jgi:hypothetical protein
MEILALELARLEEHFGHKIGISKYGDNRAWFNIALECFSCEMVICDYDYSNEDMEKGK